jgi:DNA-binding CsgD family transcriptional regulator
MSDNLLLDRSAELAAVDAALSRTRAGSGGFLLIEGAAGTGKSALMGQSRVLARDAGLRVLSARGGELERDFPFGVMRQLYEPLLTQARDGERSRLLAGAAEPAGWALGMTDGHGATYAAGFAVMHAIYWLTVAAATGTPALILVDDAHWCDASSLRALDYLARRLADVPACLLVALRPDEPGAAVELVDGLRGVPDVVRLDVGPLSRPAVAILVRRRFPTADDALCDACHAATGGNPLLLEELLRAVGPADAPSRPEDVRNVAVPSLGDRVLRRAERVDERAPTLTRAMAVLGDGARLGSAAELAGLPSDAAGVIAHRLRRIDVLAAEDPFLFVHPLIRRSVYDVIPDAERHAAHRAAASLLERAGAPADAVASHLFVLPSEGDAALARTFVTSAERALGRAAPDEAAGWLQRALDEGAPEPSRPELLAQLGMAKSLLRDPTALVHLRDAFETADRPELRHRIGVTLAELCAHAGLWAEAVAVTETVERELDDTDTELRTDAAAVRAAVTLFDVDLHKDFLARRPSYLELAKGPTWGSRALQVLLAVDASRVGRTEEALGLARRAVADGVLFRERGAGAWAPPQLLGVFMECDDADGTETALAQLEQSARATGSTFATFTMIGVRGWLQARTGDLAAAEANLRIVLGLAKQLNLLMGITTVGFFLIDVVLERSSLDEIVQLFELTQLSPEFLNTASGAMLLEVRGALRLQRRDQERGISDLRAAGAINRALMFGPTYSAWRSRLALALASASRTEALDLAHEELALATESGLPRPQATALRTLGILEEGAAAIERLEQSVAMLEGVAARVERARSLVALGSALRRANRRADARTPLAAGLEAAHESGAVRLAERAQRELEAAGGRRPRTLAGGIESLTASERRVAMLAADGASNVEIAQDLYISLKTVETHLTRAYGKLGLAGAGSRERLTALISPSR